MTSSERIIKYILVTGGVLSGLGKGILASSTGVLLQAMNCNVTSIKIDPYLNIDAGTMSPYEHGEVFVLDDGGEVDLDLGNYERFLNMNLTRDCNITTGKIYSSVIEKERRGDYLGKTVQVVPHICNEIQDWVQRVATKAFENSDPKKPCVCVIELGGTIGDIESMPFVEAMRQFQFRVKRENFCCIHLSLVPVIGAVGEQKTKPTQHSVRELRALGLSPDFIACRSSKPLTNSIKQKLAMFCHVDEEYVLGIPDVKSIYQVPLILEEQKLSILLQKRLSLFKDGIERVPMLDSWKEMTKKVELLEQQKEGIHIALVGKYTGLSDSYLSIIKSLQHASYVVEKKLIIDWVNSEHLEIGHHEINPNEYEEAWKKVKNANGILVPGGFGDRGIEGKILAIEYARKNKVPFLGICLGMQLAVIEFARNVLKMENANSEEFDPNAKHKIVVYMPEISKDKKGGTMRLGERVAYFKDFNSKIAALYGYKKSIGERHRHRYEINPELVDLFNAEGLQFVAQDETGKRQEILELKDHPYFVGVQFHPEFKSRPMKASPPFIGLMAAASNQLDKFLQQKQN